MFQNFDYPVQARLTGLLKERVNISWERLHGSDYQLDKAFKPVDCFWPGDYEGRLLLALNKLVYITQKPSPTLDNWCDYFEKFCNAGGYLGPEHTAFIDEQQLAGHGWALRGLAEMQLREPSERAWNIAANMINGFKKLLAGKVSTYPITDGQRHASGAVDGTADRCIGNWRLSTDVGAVFIFFDGLLQASRVFDIDCRELLSEFYALAQKLDVLAVKAQTHATLTLCRGLLRYDQYYQVPEAEQLAGKLYALYKQRGMTLNYANYNWFDRPEWTEPCAIVDSFMVAMELFRRTGKDEYLDDAHRIWFSGVERSQRFSGGFGGESCLNGGESELFMKFYEAPNCCNMRGAEGLYECAMRSLWCTGDNVLVIAMPIPGIFTFADGLVVEVVTGYPEGVGYQVRVLAEGAEKITSVRCFRVDENWSEAFAAAASDYPQRKRPAAGGSKFTLWQGPVMLGKDPQGDFHKLRDFYCYQKNNAETLKLQCVFEDNQQ